MKHIHVPFRGAKEARLCFEGPEGNTDAPAQSAETQKPNDALPLPGSAESPDKAQSAVQDAAQQRGSDLGSAMRAVGEDPVVTGATAAQQNTADRMVRQQLTIAGSGDLGALRLQQMAGVQAASPEQAFQNAQKQVGSPDAVAGAIVTQLTGNNVPNANSAVEGHTTLPDGRRVYVIPPDPEEANANGSAASPDKSINTPPASPDTSKDAPAASSDANKNTPAASAEQQQTTEGVTNAAEQATQAVSESGDPKADRVDKAVANLKDALKGDSIGKFISALAEVFASIKAIFKPETATNQSDSGTQKPGETGGNKPPEAGASAPAKGAESGANAPGSSPETGGETKAEKRDRVKKEVVEAGSLKDFEKGKEQQRQELEKTIQKEEDDIQALDNVNDGLERQVRTLERQIPTGDKLSPDQKKPKGQLEDQVRDLNVDIEANKQKIENNKKDIQEHADEQRKITEDVQEVHDMIKEAKEGVQNLLKALEEIAKSPEAKGIEGADKLLAGISISVDENKLEVTITLNEAAKKTIDAFKEKGVDVQKLLDQVGVKVVDAPAGSPPASPAAPAAKPAEGKPAASGEKTAEKTKQDEIQIRAARGLARVAAKFGANDRVIGSLVEKGDTKTIASMVVDALRSEKYPIYIGRDNQLYANESALGMDWMNPDTEIANNNFTNYLMTNPESALRDLGHYANRSNVNPDTKAFMYELSTLYEQGARTAENS